MVAAAAHVVFHFLHVVRGLDGNAAGIEGNALAHQSQDRRSGLRIERLVSQNDHARRLDASLCHADQRAHFQLGNFSLVENFDAEADLLGHGFSAGGQNARRQFIGGLVDQIAGEILRFGDYLTLIDGGRKVDSKARIESGKPDGLNLAVFLFGAVFIRFEIGGDQAFDDGLRRSDGSRSPSRARKTIFFTPRDFK